MSSPGNTSAPIKKVPFVGDVFSWNAGSSGLLDFRDTLGVKSREIKEMASQASCLAGLSDGTIGPGHSFMAHLGACEM